MFRAFNRARGNEQVPAGYLLGFMRKWRRAVVTAAWPELERLLYPKEQEAADLIRLAPVKDWQFREQDLEWCGGCKATKNGSVRCRSDWASTDFQRHWPCKARR